MEVTIIADSMVRLAGLKDSIEYLKRYVQANINIISVERLENNKAEVIVYEATN